jgi:hypothetical protein
MRIWLCLVMIASGLVAAPPVKVSPAKDALLKKRASAFWQTFVDAKYRLAEALVSPDSQDYYYTWPKKQIRKFRIDSIEYSEGGNRAMVVAIADTDMTLMGAGTMPIEQPVHTHWRYEKGSWYWFYPKNELRQTPFGPMPTGDGAGSKPVDIAAMIRSGPTFAALEKMVQADREQVTFKAGEEKEEVVVFNNAMPGTITMRLDPLAPGELSCVLESNEIASKSTGKLFVRYRPHAVKEGEAIPTPSGVCVVGVAQTGKSYSIRVSVAPKP